MPTCLRAYVLRVNNTRHTPLLTLPLYLFFLFAFMLSSFALHAQTTLGVRLLTTDFTNEEIIFWKNNNPNVIAGLKFENGDYARIDSKPNIDVIEAANNLSTNHAFLSFEIQLYVILKDTMYNDIIRYAKKNICLTLVFYFFYLYICSRNKI